MGVGPAFGPVDGCRRGLGRSRNLQDRIKETDKAPFRRSVPSPLKTQPRQPIRPATKPAYNGGTIVYDDDFDTPTRIHDQFLAEPTRFGKMVGRSAVTRSLFELLQRAAASDATVLIEGETGTGKEATAEAIHFEGDRKDGPFV